MKFRAAITLFVIAGFSICAGAQTLPHSGDYQEPRGVFSLTELLRIVQIYNLGSYACAGAGEDGFTPGGTPCAGPFHDGDYAPADGRISLFEVLR